MEREINNEDSPLCGLDVEEVMENLKDDLDLLKTKSNEDCDIIAEKLADRITNSSADEDIIAEISGHDAD